MGNRVFVSLWVVNFGLMFDSEKLLDVIRMSNFQLLKRNRLM